MFASHLLTGRAPEDGKSIGPTRRIRGQIQDGQCACRAAAPVTGVQNHTSVIADNRSCRCGLNLYTMGPSRPQTRPCNEFRELPLGRHLSPAVVAVGQALSHPRVPTVVAGSAGAFGAVLQEATSAPTIRPETHSVAKFPQRQPFQRWQIHLPSSNVPFPLGIEPPAAPSTASFRKSSPWVYQI